jgi:PBSX family phage terminase large subunit
MATEFRLKYLPKIYDLFNDNPQARFYVIAGGRGKGATRGIGTKLIEKSFESKRLILCSREVADTVDLSSKRTIEQIIRKNKMLDYFHLGKKKTVNRMTGSEFEYTGLSTITEDNAQGLEDVDDVWLGEAHTMEMSTWQKLEPTIRAENSTFYIDYNSQYANTPIHKLFTERPTKWPFEGKKSMGKELAYLFMTYKDNPLFPETLRMTMERNRNQYSLQDWEWIWWGKLRDASERFICDESLVRAAQERHIDLSPYGRTWVGADIAHLGGDEIVFYARRNNKIFKSEINHMLKTPETTAKLEAFMEYDKEVYLNIDNGHVGAAVADYFEDEGYKINRINFGGKVPEDGYDHEHSKDLVTDMAFNLVAGLPVLDIPKDDVLYNQIHQRKWDFIDQKGTRKIESKDDFKKHVEHVEGHKSPDRFDAMMLCCYDLEPDIIHSLGNVF